VVSVPIQIQIIVHAEMQCTNTKHHPIPASLHPFESPETSFTVLQNTNGKPVTCGSYHIITTTTSMKATFGNMGGTSSSLRRCSFESLNNASSVGGVLHRKNMTAVLNREANITKLVASTVEAALLLLLPLGELASDPDAVELGAPVPPARVES